MRKLLIMLVAIAFFQQNANAQIFSWGVRLGAVSTSIDVTPQTISNANMDSILLTASNANFGIQGGLYTRIKLGPVYVQPEVLFTSESYNYTKEDLNGSGIQEALTDRFNSLDIPIMVGFKMGPFRLQGGPIGSLLISNNNQLETLSETYNRKLSNLTWGYQAGAGVDIGSVNVDLKYEGSLSAIADSYEIYGNEYQFDARENRWVLTIGLKF
ncbi:MAG: PorT family protein [Saprospiraceae bacterium]|nr:PorT family protein [Saprospiraceae bacterium]